MGVWLELQPGNGFMGGHSGIAGGFVFAYGLLLLLNMVSFSFQMFL